ncbi:MAG: ABC transporter permease [Acidimicrobiales bacterium]
MLHYTIKRFFQAIVVLIMVSLVIFGLLHALPGGLVRAQLGPRASAASVAHLTRLEGLTKPLPVQYGVWLGNLLHGTLGFSYTQNTPVSTLLAEYFPRTLILFGSSLVLTILIAVPLGLFQGARRNRLEDYSISGALLTVYSTPGFLLGMVLIVLFSIEFHVLPSGATSFGKSLGTDVNVLILPVLTLALGSVAYYSRFVRSSVIDSLLEDYVRTARAKGAGRPRILVRHVLRNSLLPLVSVVGITLPTIVSGTLIVEFLFAYPGLGLLYWDSQQKRTYPVMLGIVLLLGVFVIAGNLFADLAYSILDPRVRYD